MTFIVFKIVAALVAAAVVFYMVEGIADEVSR